jgi:hypothetical protein
MLTNNIQNEIKEEIRHYELTHEEVCLIMLALEHEKTLCVKELYHCIERDLDQMPSIRRYKQVDDILSYFREVKDN